MLNQNKINHCVQVAYQARQYLAEMLPDDDPDRLEKLDAAFIMGLLHDVGYDKLGKHDDPTPHAEISADMVRHFMKHAFEVQDAIRRHGRDDCSNVFGYALNKADMTVDSNGNMVSMEDRMARIERNYPGTEHAGHARQQYENILKAEARFNQEKTACARQTPAKTTRKAVDFDTFSSACPWAYQYGDGDINNGYNCSHPEQEMTEDAENGNIVGRCHCFSCPLGTMAESQDINPDPDDDDAIHDEIDWGGIVDEPGTKPDPDEIDEEDTLLVCTDTGRDSDEAEALFWWDARLHRFDAKWKKEHEEDYQFYNDRVNKKRMPAEKEDPND